MESEVLPNYTRQGGSRIRNPPQKIEENILSQLPGKAAASTQGWIRSRLPEQDLGRRVQGCSGEDGERPYCLDRGPNKGARPVASDPRFRRPEAAPRPSMGTGSFTEKPRKKLDQLGHGHLPHPSRPDHGQIWDRKETELSGGSEPEPALPDDQWASTRNRRKFYGKAQAIWQSVSHQLSPRRQHASKGKEGGSRLGMPDSGRHWDRFDATSAYPRKRTVGLSYSDRLGWSSISERESSDDEATQPTEEYSQRKGRLETASRPPTEAKRDIKLERFDGTVRVESFLAKFEICSRHNRWNEADRMDNLQCALTGEAAQILWDMGADGVKTSKDFIQQLQARYGSANQTALYRTRLKFRRRQRGETLAELVNDVRRFIVLAYPGPSLPIKEAFACEAFLEALNDKELALKIREKEPPTLEEAYQFAMRLEAYAVVHEPDKSDRKVFLPRKVTEGQTRPETDPDKFLETLRNMSGLQQASFEKLLGEIKTIVERHNAPLSNKRSQNRRRLGQQKGNQEPRRRFGNKKCFQCREVGHLIAKCPYLVSGDATDDNQKTFRTVDKATNRINEQDGVYLRVILAGKMHRALVDTGSVSSSIPDGIIPLETLRKTDSVLKAANGVEIEVMGETCLDLQVDDLVIPLNFLVVRDVPEVILGMNWIREYVDSFDLKNGKIIIQGRALSLSIESDERVPNGASNAGRNHMVAVGRYTCGAALLDTATTKTDCPRIVDQPQSTRRVKRKPKYPLPPDDQRDGYRPSESIELSRVARVMADGERATKIKRRLGFERPKRADRRKRSSPTDAVDLNAGGQSSFHRGDRCSDQQPSFGIDKPRVNDAPTTRVIRCRRYAGDIHPRRRNRPFDKGGVRHDHRQRRKRNQRPESRSSDIDDAPRVYQTSGNVLRRVPDSPADNDQCRRVGQNDKTERRMLIRNKSYV